jgi:P27 family predicted phage terminase small subunit
MPMPRKSDAERALTGRLGKEHDRAADVSSVPAGRPRIPSDIQSLGLRGPFKKLCRLLSERRVLTSGDVELIRLFVIIQARHIRNAALLQTEGELMTYIRLDSNGQPHPQVKVNLRLKVCSDAERQMAAILNQLGMTPVAKDRAKPTQPEMPDEKELTHAEKYMKGLDERKATIPFRPMEPPASLEEE